MINALPEHPTIAVLIPCYNEEIAIGKVVRDFCAALPQAAIYVYDNNSTDRTVEEAENAGALVRRERLQGKGNVLRRMFADVEADIYVLVDGDDTYDASCAPQLIAHLIDERLDMVNAARETDIQAAYRPGHRFGNRLLTGLISYIFGKQVSDILSGYRVFSRRFVKSFPALSTGFETETELTVHALELHMPLAEIKTPYKDRPQGSASKLHTFRDGFRILKTILILVKRERPMQLFSLIAGIFFLIAIVLFIPLLITYQQTGLVPRIPTAVLVAGIMVLSFLSLVCGIILDSVTCGRREAKRIWYLRIPVLHNGKTPSDNA